MFSPLMLSCATESLEGLASLVHVGRSLRLALQGVTPIGSALRGPSVVCRKDSQRNWQALVLYLLELDMVFWGALVVDWIPGVIPN